MIFGAICKRNFNSNNCQEEIFPYSLQGGYGVFETLEQIDQRINYIQSIKYQSTGLNIDRRTGDTVYRNVSAPVSPVSPVLLFSCQ